MSVNKVITEKLELLIGLNQINQAIDAINNAPLSDMDSRAICENCEQLVFTVLQNENSTPELIDTVLEKFISTKGHYSSSHRIWAHSLTHFVELLWEKRLVDWIKKLTQIFLDVAKEIDDFTYIERFVSYFTRHANWDDDPADVSLSMKDLSGAPLDFSRKERLKLSPFNSETDFLNWQLSKTTLWTEQDYNTKMFSMNIEEVSKKIQRLEELGANKYYLKGLKSLWTTTLTRQLNELLLRQKNLTEKDHDFTRIEIENKIKETQSALANAK